MARTVTGIDVGSHTSLALRGAFKKNTFHATGFAAGQHRGGDTAAAWGALKPGFKPTAARIGISGRGVNVRYTRVPQVPDWQLRNLMRFEVAEIGDQSGAEVASDFNLLPQIPEIEGEDVVLLAMARESMLEEHDAGLRSIGGALDAFSPSAIGLYNAWLRFGVIEEDTVLVANVGHENIDVVICRGPDLLFARNLSGGSRLFQDAIAQNLGCSDGQAEKLKVDMTTLRPGAKHPTPNHERASRAVLGAAGQLLSLLQSTVLFCKSQVKITSLRIDRVLLCGGGAALDGLPEYLAGGMGVPVDLFDPFSIVDTSGLSPEELESLDEYKLESVVALGLATMASDTDSYSLEILPAALAKSRQFWGGTFWLIASAVLALTYLGYSAVVEKGKLDDIRARNASISSQLRRAVAVHNEATALAAESETLSELAHELEGVVGSGEQLARVLSILGRDLPADFWVQRLSSAWSADEELRVIRADERPILSIKGRTREGTDSPAVLYQAFTQALSAGMPGARINPSLTPTGDGFSVDLTLFGPPSEDPVAGDDAGSEADAEG
ncbi:MAG: Tfp pilus assembly PilM family ATPase [Chlamydiales bacterium]|jgi:Tfp pilus assembly PilM family ATPase